ncbi:MAG: DUF2914 domain-containing protein [Candidatus Aminicenantes bacterium]|nr:DUF2914 domain-containing protein [Candidatus Aminicenantes bacterium]
MRIFSTVIIFIIVFQFCLFPYELSRFVLTRDIKDNEPADSDTVFFLVEDSIFCFTEFKNITNPFRITHKWFCNNRLVGRVELRLKPARRWRTWSRKRFKNCSGKWMVQVCNLQGKILAEKKFIVKKI